MRTRLAVILALALGLAGTAFAQGPWAKKDWKQWSKDDCKKILEDSPWARRWAHSEAKMANFATRPDAQGRGGSGTEGVGSESELTIYYIVQFRSALPIRQAVVRQAQIENKYDRMESKQREAVDKQTEGFLNRKFDDIIVVHVMYGSNVQEYNRDLATFWQTHYPEGTVPQEAFLDGPKGQKITPLRLLSPKGGAQEFELIFPRLVNGEPLVSPSDKTVGIEFVAPTIAKIAGERVFVEFKLDRMTLDGRPVY